MVAERRRAWREPEAAPARPTPAGRRRKLFLAAGAFLAVLGAIVGLFFWLRPAPDPYFVPLWITEYESPHLPVNAWARQDREALREGQYFSRHANTFASQELHLLLRELTALKDREGSAPVVVYLSAHARTGPRGEILLLPGTARPDDPRTGLPLARVLEALRDAPAHHKLLILDLRGPAADLLLGPLLDDVAARVPAELEAVADPRRLTLTACAPGQVPLTSEDLGRSVFGYYVEDALRGWADGHNDRGERDDRVSARELAAFVRQRVERWAHDNRRARQTPTLYGAADDFSLVVLDDGQPKPHRPPRSPEPYPPVLRARWDERDKLAADAGLRSLAPRAFRDIEAGLLRAEARWRAGIPVAQVERDLADQWDRFQRRLAEARALPRLPVRTLAGEPKPDEKVRTALRDLLAKVRAAERAPGAKPEEVKQTRAKLVEEFLSQVKEISPVMLAQAAWDQAADDPDAETIRLLDHLLRARQPQPEYVETLFLRRLVEQVSVKEWRGDVIRRALEVVRQGAEAAAEPRALPWVRDCLTAAAATQRKAEALLFGGTPAALTAADPLLRDAERDYRAINRDIRTIRDAYRSYEDALTALPSYAAYLAARPEANYRDEEAWRDAVRSARELGEALADPAAGLAELERRSAALQRHLADLQQSFVADMDRLKAQTRAAPLNDQAFEALLTTPFPSAADRVALWQKQREHARALLEHTLKDDAPGRLAAPVGDDLARAVREQRERAVRQAERSLALLEVAGLDAGELEKLNGALAAARGQDDAAAWDVLGRQLRDAWARQLPAQLPGLAEQGRLLAADRLSRLLHPLDQPSGAGERNWALMLHWAERRALAEWLRDRYQADSRHLPEADAWFYTRSARELGEYVRDAPGTPGAPGRPAGCFPTRSPAAPAAVGYNLRETSERLISSRTKDHYG